MIFTLCGSARFEPVWHEANKQLGLAGHICFSLMTFPSIEGSKSWYTEEQKTMLDLMHLAKIDASDAVLMLNVGDYLGESSRRELAWARHKQKLIYWLRESSLHSRQDEFHIPIGSDTAMFSLELPRKNVDAILSVCSRLERDAPL